jgi:hypothetical protein
MLNYTVDELISDVRTTASIPEAQPRFSDDGLLKIMTRVLQSKIVPMMMAVREEYFVAFKDYEIVQGNVTGYKIPSDAVGMKARSVVLLNQSNTLNMTNIPRLSLEQVSGYYYGQYVPFGFYVQNNNVILWPPNQTSPTNTLRIYYLSRTKNLVYSDEAGKVDAINSNIVTLESVPDTWAVGNIVNVIYGEPGFETVLSEAEILDITSLDVTLDTVTGITIGDWVALKGYSPIAQIPIEAQQLLVQATSLEILKSLGDNEGYQKLEIEYQRMSQYVMDVISPRVDGSPKKAIGANSIGDWLGPWSNG